MIPLLAKTISALDSDAAMFLYAMGCVGLVLMGLR
jgi:hypothetical protein